MEQLIQRMTDLERLVRETRESTVRIEATLEGREVPGHGEKCRWHEAQLSALRDFDTDLAGKVDGLAKADLTRTAAAGVWTLVGRVAVGFIGAVFALLGQWGLQVASAHSGPHPAAPPAAAHAPP
jgi:hypothetical protein